MTTHILIPIMDIETLKEEEESSFAGDYQTVRRYERLIEYAKQISLDEKDIEEKAEEWAIDKQNDECSPYYNAFESYKQALKDLI